MRFVCCTVSYAARKIRSLSRVLRIGAKARPQSSQNQNSQLTSCKSREIPNQRIRRSMRWIWSGASLLIRKRGRAAVCAAVLLTFAFAAPAWGTGLRMGMRLRQEVDQPLIPVTRNFRPCFRQGADGVPVLGLCPEGPGAAPAPVPRAPAAEQPKAPTKLAPRP